MRALELVNTLLFNLPVKAAGWSSIHKVHAVRQWAKQITSAGGQAIFVQGSVEEIDDAKLLGVRIVDFTGGEPLLYEGLPECSHMPDISYYYCQV